MIRRLLRWLAGGVVLFYVLCAASLICLKFINCSTTAVQLQRRVEAYLAGRPYTARHTFVPLSRIAKPLAHAVIAAEDSRFYQHHGIDWEEVRKAAADDTRHGHRLRGASTITQQLVKNLFLTTHRWTLRKVAELPLALLAELILSKQRILELYLNLVEWGPGVFGAEAAAQYHYGISAAQLTRDHAARLAACLPAPRTRRPQRMTRYADTILERMGRMGY